MGLYCRVSHDPTGRGTSVADQEKEGREWCAANGHTVAWVVVDNDISASRHSKKERPGFNDVKARLAGADSVDILWAWESSRFTRDLEVYAQIRSLCERHEVLWSYHGRTYDMSRADDRFNTGLDALISERSSDDTRDRVVRAVNARVDAGRAHGRIPYGYRAVYHLHTGAPIGREPDPTTSLVVREIVRRVLAADPNYQIAKDLNRRGVVSPHAFRLQRQGKPIDDARPWTINLVRAVAENPSNAALRTHNGVVVGDATWEPLISVEDFHAVRARFADPARRSTRDREVRHLLPGIALCGVCGEPCRRVVNHDYPSYVCRGHSCVSRLQKFVDLLVVDTLLERLGDVDAGTIFAREDSTGQIAAAVAELAELEARLEEFRVSAESPDGISVATLARMEARYGPLIADARGRSVPAHVPAVVRDLVQAPNVGEYWESLSVARRRVAVKHLVTVTILPTTTRGPKGFDPSRVRITWRHSGQS